MCMYIFRCVLYKINIFCLLGFICAKSFVTLLQLFILNLLVIYNSFFMVLYNLFYVLKAPLK